MVEEQSSVLELTADRRCPQLIAGRIYIAGRLNNTPDNLTAWIIDPHAFDPQNVMPPTGVSRGEARDIAAYLYTLK